jgi:hypothetical protein
MRNGQLVEKQTAPPKGGVFVFSDIQPFATQDGTPIGSRSTLREYEQRTGTRQVGNDWADSKTKERIYGRHG